MSEQLIEITPGLGVGHAPSGWRPLADSPLLILVGVTGVGKSTIVDELRGIGVEFTLLPNRRELTDQLIIGHIQQQDGEVVMPVRDRRRRFDYSRRYRERNPGGMAHALGRLQVDPALLGGLKLFDGLRGVNEVSHAATHLPAAHFIVLDAPDIVRVQRLLGRNDAFDQFGDAQTAAFDAHLRDFQALGVADARRLFSLAEEQALLDLARRGDVTAADLAAKLRIVVTERRSYDPGATITALQGLAVDRTVVIDTVQMNPDEAARHIQGFLINDE